MRLVQAAPVRSEQIAAGENADRPARRRPRNHRQPSDFFLQHVVGGLAQGGVLEHHGERTVYQLGNPCRGGALRIEQIAAGCSPGDIVTMSELSPLNRSLLNDGVREIVAVQRRVRQMAAMNAGMLT